MAEPNNASSAAPAEMPSSLVRFLIGGQTCVVATVDAQGRPTTTLMTWVVARNPQGLAAAVDLRSQSFRNLRDNGQIALEILGDDICYGLRGRAVVEKETMDAAPFRCALVAVHVEECRDHGAGGVKFVGPRYSFRAGKEHRAEVEQAVFDELKGPAPTI